MPHPLAGIEYMDFVGASGPLIKNPTPAYIATAILLAAGAAVVAYYWIKEHDWWKTSAFSDASIAPQPDKSVPWPTIDDEC